MRTNAPRPGEEKARGIGDPVGDPDGVVIVGGGQTGRRLAEQLSSERSVHHVDEAVSAVAHPRGYETSHVLDVASTAALAAAGVTDDDVAIVLAGPDSRTLLVTQLLRTAFGTERVYAVLADPRNRDAFDIPEVTVVCGTVDPTEAVLERTVEVVTLDGDGGVDGGTATGSRNGPGPGEDDRDPRT